LSVNAVQVSNRRDQITVMLDLLSYVTEPKRLTHMLYNSNMSYTQLSRYIKLLKGYGFIQEEEKPFRSYLITRDGKAFVNIMTKGKSNPN